MFSEVAAAGDGDHATDPLRGGAEPCEDDAGPFNVGEYRLRLPPAVYVPPSDEIEKLHETYTAMGSSHYDLSRGTKLALIFNHRRFMGRRMDPRDPGTDRDCDAIKRVFEGALGFHVERHDDLKAAEVDREISRVQELPVDSLSCLALFILTHGEQNGVLYAYDANYRLDKHIVGELLPDRCPSLAGKPKMIFVQACQGDNADGGVRVRSRHSSTDGTGGTVYCIPNYSDLLVYQAAYHGFYSFRAGSGSWFIQALCRALEESKGGEELDRVLKRVSRRVALLKVSNVPQKLALDNKKQIPLKQCTLIREIYLKGGCEAQEQEQQQEKVANGGNKKKKRRPLALCKKDSAKSDDLGNSCCVVM